MRWLLLMLIPLLSSCAGAQIVDRAGRVGTAALDELAETVDALGDISDRALQRAEGLICDEHFSQRAYRKRYNTAERQRELREFCQWDVAPLDLGGRDSDGVVTDDR